MRRSVEPLACSEPLPTWSSADDHEDLNCGNELSASARAGSDLGTGQHDHERRHPADPVADRVQPPTQMAVVDLHFTRRYRRPKHGHRRHYLRVPETRLNSCDLLILVEQPVELVLPSDAVGGL
jgi:hypothetical protein